MLHFKLDPHCHTISSGHAYSSLQEMAAGAEKNGIELIVITDHGPKMPGAPHPYYFGNIKTIPRWIGKTKILRGVEANIINHLGHIDIPEEFYDRLDVILASLHDIVVPPDSVENNTKALIHAMENTFIDIIAHSGNPVYPIDIEQFVEAARINHTLIEINSHSYTARKGSYENCRKILKIAKSMELPVILGSDAHISMDVGNFHYAYELIKEVEYPENLIMNISTEKFLRYLADKGKEICF